MVNPSRIGSITEFTRSSAVMQVVQPPPEPEP
jgi:hypothetical protein